MSNAVWPHRRQPTRLPRPWDSPGKNTGVDCYFLLQCMKVKSESEIAQFCPILQDPWTAAYQAPLSMDFPGKSTGVGCHGLLHLTQQQDTNSTQVPINQETVKHIQGHKTRCKYFRVSGYWNHTVCSLITVEITHIFSSKMWHLPRKVFDLAIENSISKGRVLKITINL